jgi:glycosyltransferase involved in cell wall biosynthesis
VPLYNKAPHVARAISSVLSQSHGEFELVIVDDASTDGSIDKVNRFDDPRIRLFHRDSPGPGGYAARNFGIQAARSDWVMFLDADDEWFPNHLEKTKELIDRFPDAAFTSCGWLRKSGEEMTRNEYFTANHTRGPHMISLEEYLLNTMEGRRPANAAVAGVNKQCLRSHCLFPENSGARRGGDLHAWLTVVCQQKALSWSNHLGAVYHTDSVNMVTRSAPSVPYLMSRKYFDDLSEGLSQRQRALLKREFNLRLIYSWKGTILRNEPGFFLARWLFWTSRPVRNLPFAVLSLVPVRLLSKIVRACRRYLP